MMRFYDERRIMYEWDEKTGKRYTKTWIEVSMLLDEPEVEKIMSLWTPGKRERYKLVTEKGFHRGYCIIATEGHLWKMLRKLEGKGVLVAVDFYTPILIRE